MMRALFDADVKPKLSYGCEVWGNFKFKISKKFCSALAGSLQPGLNEMVGLQIAISRTSAADSAYKGHLSTCSYLWAGRAGRGLVTADWMVSGLEDLGLQA